MSVRDVLEPAGSADVESRRITTRQCIGWRDSGWHREETDFTTHCILAVTDTVASSKNVPKIELRTNPPAAQ